ncbi:MAG TPA: hypothetical protein VHA12_01060 [Candidatus Nanoarchaeia archaeon]|nr:hypothetical protein [Candidatus Nanoarchaeia archaeon]
MVEKHEIHKEIDKRVEVIDSKLKNAFSLIKKDIHEIKKHHTHKPEVVKFYEAKLNQERMQSTMDKAQMQAEYGRKLSALENKQEELKHTIFELSKQIQVLNSKHKIKKEKFSSPVQQTSNYGLYQILGVFVIAGLFGYLLFSNIIPASYLTGVVGSSGALTIAGITGALLFILTVLALLFYVKRRKHRVD